ncbi:4-alpha-glucanotransferase [Salinimicrobium xinjiangense]|uniref:4-alpha-glucanotransferase n=1 Tax=Salinimicrobium xinjiangense TaxID=438596 RepID=UPI000410E80D|nr:4-alpha-glucanotransferase [Salinimicrobium xinjiangense]
MKLKRSSGILLHITSLPGKFGIGDLGPEAHKFLDFLKRSGHKYWQILPLNPTDGIYHHSPYSSHSAFAGNPMLISPSLLEEDGYIDLEDFPAPSGLHEGKVVFDTVETYKHLLFEAAFSTFKSWKGVNPGYEEFLLNHASWLDNYCLYLALRHRYKNANWVEWPAALRDRNPAALEQAEEELRDTIEKEKFVQYLFFSQWGRLMKEAHNRGIKIFGDVPFYINHDSADCWTNPELFKLNEDKNPTHVSGVPPDMFSKTGQLWGTPVYDWEELERREYAWWIDRLRQNLLLFDVVRIDHFRAFAAYWEVPAGEKTAIHGKWKKTPGIDFFRVVKQHFPKMPFIAEDLGVLDEPVYELLDAYNFPGMKVLQFAFGDPNRGNPYIPYNHSFNSIIYTGTHDNNTTLGWYREAGKEVKEHVRDYLGRKISEEEIPEVFHRMALQSVGGIAIIPLQDIIGLGGEAIMNTPGSTKGNWSWRVRSSEIPMERSHKLFKLNELYGRVDLHEERS